MDLTNHTANILTVILAILGGGGAASIINAWNKGRSAKHKDNEDSETNEFSRMGEILNTCRQDNKEIREELKLARAEAKERAREHRESADKLRQVLTVATKNQVYIQVQLLHIKTHLETDPKESKRLLDELIKYIDSNSVLANFERFDLN